MVIKGHMNTINSLSLVIAVIDMHTIGINRQSCDYHQHRGASTQCVNECVVRWC